MSDTPNPPIGEPTPGQTPPPPPLGGPPAPGMGDPADVEKNKVFALLSYVSILWLVPLLAAKDSPFAKYHANQGILLTIGMVILCVVLSILYAIVMFIPILGRIAACFGCVVYLCVFLAYVGLAIMGILNAVNGKMKPLPGFPAITLVK